MAKLATVLASPSAPKVIWLQGSACSGCTISFLNRIAASAPATAADVLLSTISLSYHPTVMAEAGQGAANIALELAARGKYILVIEGGVPTSFGGAACFAWTSNGEDVTFQKAVQRLAQRASSVVCVGACSAYGGVPAMNGNPTGVVSVAKAIGRPTINVSGCPPHPDWIVWTLANLVAGQKIKLDSVGRPTALYSKTVHSQCPRREAEEADTFGTQGLCLEGLGCRGPKTKAPCAITFWNGKVNWCIGANAPCYGCTEANFPQTPLWKGED